MAKKKKAQKHKDLLQTVEAPPGEHFKILLSDDHSSRMKALIDKINQRSQPPKPALHQSAPRKKREQAS